MTVRLKSYCNSIIGNVIKSSVRPSMPFSPMTDLRAVFSSAGRGGSVVVLRARPVGRNCSGQHCETLCIIVWDRLGHRVKRCEVTDCALLWFGPPLHHIWSIHYYIVTIFKGFDQVVFRSLPMRWFVQRVSRWISWLVFHIPKCFFPKPICV